MTLTETGNIVAVTAYFFLSCLFFWVACIPKTNKSTLWWGLATCCTLLARLSFLTLKPYLSPPLIEAIYALLISTEKACLLIGFIQFFNLSGRPITKVIMAVYVFELFSIITSKYIIHADTFFAIQFSLINAAALGAIAFMITKYLPKDSLVGKTPITTVLLLFIVHWLTFPIARHYPEWLQYGLIFGNFVNLVLYLSYATLALIAFQTRLLNAEKEALIFAEKANQSNLAKSEFLANMSHEIRTPMNGVLGMLDQLIKSPLNDDQKHKVAVAQSSGKSLLTLINDILDFSKIDAGKLCVEKTPFNLQRALEDIHFTMFPLAQAKGLEFTFVNIEDNSHDVIGDPSRLRQILTNLIGNAIKFTPQGSITITSTLTRQSNNTASLHCSIIDSGIGIDDEQVAHLFQAFSQADTSTTRKYGGTGLGLTISQRICQLMGGSISYKSADGKGSEFYFTLPFKTIAASRENQPATSPPAPDSEAIPTTTINHPVGNASPETTRILLVEDNEINQFVAVGILEDYQFTCEAVFDGEKAIERLNQDSQRDNPFKLILMDCQMPVMDGYACTEAIRKGIAGTKYQSIPIIAMTANAMKGDKEKCLAAGMDDYVSKPIDETTFISTVRHWVKSH